MDGATAAVEARGLVVERGGTRILDGVSLRVGRGEVVALLGPNGCGKTTLARCLVGQVWPTAGAVELMGHRLGGGGGDLRELRRRVAVVNPTLDEGEMHATGATVDGELDAVSAVCTGWFGTVGLYDEVTAEQRARAEALLRTVGLGHRLRHRVAVLSTGERRRLLVARAMAGEPELLILDEPTAGLDVAGREQVLAAVERVVGVMRAEGGGRRAEGPRPGAGDADGGHGSSGVAPASSFEPPGVLMITHHVEELSPRTSRVVMMKAGRVVAEGRPGEVIDPEVLSAVYGCKVYVRRVHGRWWLEVLPEAWLDLMTAEG
ncbi:MAG: ATP-binding cassette domain-containing protein [Planctomycetota bacterium]